MPRMASVYLVRRDTKKGTRWHVRCETGRNDPILHLGVFAKESDALLRRNTALGELARGVTPSKPRIVDNEPAPTTTVAEAGAAWLASLLDLAAGTKHYYARTIASMPDWLASMDPAAVRHAHVQAWVDEMQRKGWKRGTIRREVVALRQALYYAGVETNAAGDRRVRYPRARRKVYRLPTRAQLAEMHDALPDRSELMLLLEHTGVRTIEAAGLRVRDVDRKRGRILVDSKTEAGLRWVERLPGTPDFPVRVADADARVFSPSPHSLNAAIRNAHKRHGTFLMSAHEFRHLHASRLLHDGILSPAQIAARLGHATPATTLEIYSHVVPPD